MIVPRPSLRSRAFAALLVAAATIFVGLAHRPLAGLDARALAALTWAEKGGAEWCEPNGGTTPSIGRAICDACLLAGAPGLPPPVTLALPIPEATCIARFAALEAPLAAARVVAHGARGPPKV